MADESWKLVDLTLVLILFQIIATQQLVIRPDRNGDQRYIMRSGNPRVGQYYLGDLKQVARELE